MALFRKKIERSCTYCAYGVQIDARQVLCAKKGILQNPDSCRRFRYDPLKRIPPRKKSLDFSKYSNEDFSL